MIEFLRQLRRHDTAATVAVAVDGHPADLAVCNGVLALAARQLGNPATWEPLSLLQNYKNAVTPAEAGVQKPLTSLDSCFRRNDRKKQV